MKKYTVSLSFQCDQNWNNMPPVERGRHCNACNKVVVDFSQMTDTQIVNYLLQNKNTCGKFNPNQLNRTYSIYPDKKRSNWGAIAAMLIAGMFSLSTPHLSAGVHGNVIQFERSIETFIHHEDHKKVEPDKFGKIRFTVRLFFETNKTKIHGGSIVIAGLGTFQSNENGDILIEFSGEQLPQTIEVTVMSSLGDHYYKLDKKDLKNSTHADLYLTEAIMPAGTVSIHEE